jgi:hypothetical protein
MEESTYKLMVRADEEITGICGGKTEYLEWLGRNSPGVAALLADTGTKILSPQIELLPFPVAEALVRVFVAAHAYAHAMWMHRDGLGQLSQPVTH